MSRLYVNTDQTGVAYDWAYKQWRGFTPNALLEVVWKTTMSSDYDWHKTRLCWDYAQLMTGRPSRKTGAVLVTRVLSHTEDVDWRAHVLTLEIRTETLAFVDEESVPLYDQWVLAELELEHKNGQRHRTHALETRIVKSTRLRFRHI